MKKHFSLLLIFSIVSSFAFSQMSQDDIGMIQSMYGMSKRDLVQKYMKLPAGQDSAFWKIYNEYEIARKEIGAKRIQLLQDYANNYATLTDDKANELITEVLKLNGEQTKLYQKYYGKMKKVISPLKAAQFIQLEVYLENAVRTQIQSQIPFIGDLDRH